MNILIIASTYPTHDDPVSGVFIKRIVEQFSEFGHICTVISPRKFLRDKPRTEYERQGNVNVYFPQYFGLWYDSKIKGDLIARVSEYEYYRAVVKVINEKNIEFDVVYAHFVGITATVAEKIAKRYKKKAFAACGESNFWTISKYDKVRRVNALNQLNGIISVSSENREKLLALGVKDVGKKIRVFPNGVQSNIFYPMDKMYARDMMGFKHDDFIVGFSGYFIERKGVLRLSKAVDGLKGVKVAFAGKGEQKPHTDNMIMCKQISPEKMPFYLNSLDVFVLPTLQEGCCNAIVEAIACGIPVISSNRSFNDDILDDSYSIRINPESIDEIRNAIILLKNNKKMLLEMTKSAVETGKNFSIRVRAEKILQWIMETIYEYTED